MGRFPGVRGVLASCGLALALGASAVTPATAQKGDFYAGKTLNLVVGYAPGGGSDITCRLFAAHLGRHIAGSPTVVVRNMPGASGANAINYVGEVARKDGTTGVCGTISILLTMLDDPALRVDLRKFKFLVGVGDSQGVYVRADVKPGIKKAEDVFKAQDLLLGGFLVASAKDVPARLTLDLLGLKHRYVTGIRGDGAGRTAMQQGIINVWMEGVASFATITMETMVKPGDFVALFQSGLLDDNGDLTKRDPSLPDLPTFVEFYKAHFGKEPSGEKWDALNAILAPYAVSQRAFAMPEGTPPEALEALRKGIAAMVKDPAFIADSKKAMGEGVQIFAGEGVQKAFLKGIDVAPETKAFLKAYVEEGKKLAGRK